LEQQQKIKTADHRTLLFLLPPSSHLPSTDTHIKIPSNIILPVVLYGCETRSLTLREGRLRVFENRVLKSDEVKREWRKIHNEELYDSCSLLNVIPAIN